MCHYRMVDGLIAEHTILYDEMDLSRQLGLLPPFESRSFRLMAVAPSHAAAGRG